MPNDVPPTSARPEPRYCHLPAGSFLWRVHRSAAAGDPPKPVFKRLRNEPGSYDPDLTGRFGPTSECPYPYCYAALDDLTALCEVLLRDFGFDGPLRYLPRSEVTGRSLAILETRAPLWLVSLVDAADLAAARQDSWLVHAGRGDYRITRRWAHWLRDSTGPDGNCPPAGIVWRSKRQPAGRVVLLFGDRCENTVISSPFAGRPLDDRAGVEWLNLRLSLLNTRLAP
jgi:hypothetical protein